MSEIKRFGAWINGQERDVGKWEDVSSPITGETWAQVAACSPAVVDEAAAAAHAALSSKAWAGMGRVARAALLRDIAEEIRRCAPEMARIESTDNGKLLKEMKGQWDYLPEWFHYYAGMLLALPEEVAPNDRDNFLILTRRVPVGVVAAITAWNSPGLLLIFKLAAGLAAGCTFVVKPSEHAPISTILLGRLLKRAGLPDGVFNVVTGDSAVGSQLVDHPAVDKIAFTGSDGVGRLIAAAAGKTLKRVSLELGGKSANVVFADADLDNAVNGCIAGIFAATGQTCMAGSRLLVERSIYDDMLERLKARTEAIRVGDPLDPDTDMGPCANAPQLEKVLGYIEIARQEGARLLTGGVRRRDLGDLYVAPTIFADVAPGMRIAKEEVFGPILSVIPFDTEDDAVRIANDNPYGLAGAVWTRDVHRAHRVADRLQAGSVWINAYRVVSYCTPFGGMKQSGLGRENGIAGYLEFTEAKSVYVELTGAPRDPFKLG